MSGRAQGAVKCEHSQMSGETDLSVLLREMAPRLHDGAYVFTTITGPLPANAEPVVTVREAEGTTLVLRRSEADLLGLPYDYPAAWITLEAHSALAAVGLTAAVSAALAEAGISCNVVAGYFHDHLFVPYDRAADAVERLRELR
jgi:uncharacterized protein